MRELPDLYKGVDRVVYACLVAKRLLGLDTLDAMPAFLGGFRSITDHRALTDDARLAIHNLRLMHTGPATLRIARQMLVDYNEYHRRREAGRLDPSEDLGFARRIRLKGSALGFEFVWVDSDPDDIQQAMDALRTPLPMAPTAGRQFHDVAREATIKARSEGGFSGVVHSAPIDAADPPTHDFEHVPQPPGFIAWAEILAEAERMDQEDLATGRRTATAASWARRLVSERGEALALLRTRVVANDGQERFTDADGLTLVGVQHLIGLVGAGKSTLLYILGVLLGRRGVRCLFLFPSIEVASAYVEVVSRYGVTTGLVFGQGSKSREKHVGNLARSLGASNGGLGATRPIARLFATTCVLQAYTDESEIPFPHSVPPCNQLRQAQSGKRRLEVHHCRLGSLCGRQASERELVNATIWAGHISSTDRRMPGLFSPYQVHYFELVARGFDLVVVDECDDAQVLLDGNGATALEMYGSRQSLGEELARQFTARAAGGELTALSSERLTQHRLEANRFDGANVRLMRVLDDLQETVKSYYRHKLLTSATLFSDLYPVDTDAADHEQERQHAQQVALERLWMDAVKRVVFGARAGGDDDEDWIPGMPVDRAAADLGRSEEDVLRLVHELARALSRWDDVTSWVEGADEAGEILRRFQEPPASDLTQHWAHMMRLMTAVSFVVLQFGSIKFLLRLWSSVGVLEDLSFEPSCSAEMLRVIPETLLGRLSGVRYEYDDPPDSRLKVSHVSFLGAPRALLYDLGRLYRHEGVQGPAVLLTSATSFLKDSPSNHVPVGPHYLLKRPNAGQGWSRSRYQLLPLRHPIARRADGSDVLRFSGSPFSQRTAILRAMVDKLLEGKEFAPLWSALATNDVVDGVSRKGALIVNSYDQVQSVMEHLRVNHADVVGRFRGLTRSVRSGAGGEYLVAASEVEKLNSDPTWDVLVFPPGAIGRGVNVVFKDGKRQDHAMLGSLFFLTRPHPKSDSLQFLQGLAGSASQAFAATEHPQGLSVNELHARYLDARRLLGKQIEWLVRVPLYARRLGKMARPFVADQMVQILQTVGRAMRNDCPAFVYFVDQAWAPSSMSSQQADSSSSSMLVMMLNIIEDLLNAPNAADREVYRELYQPFYEPLKATTGLVRE